ncbi:MAG: bifunctional UDP-N-acetylglucosamine diphosphorylase/glucosamine-1-phosphate N-acetyltransferase GlmU [Actinomycetota bacterium]|nr:bifunctional UDP-N-acetylglucosamine diphosphorylase/glucosamine-1-phosphate N-acetyltransferase GlmU [Actinomycetota bacterium]MDQ3647237.1 bifunctional UDP-N-acetylglucosamine diphosphorylase/glucosamine-1-phosphate N-acetyltransferase GlmU [Actinomycetota bacterium]
MAEPFTALIMAAGHGTRMRSGLPKVLHPVCGKPMVEWVVEAVREAGAEQVVCVVRPGEGVVEGLPAGVDVAEQREGEGTGAAVLAAREAIAPERPLAVLSGDHPLVGAEVISDLVAEHASAKAAATVLSTDTLDPTGYGRVIRDAGGAFEAIVETKHPEGLPPDVLATREINLGTYVFQPDSLFRTLEQVEPRDGELYLTGAISAFAAEGRVATSATADADVARGVNTRADLMEVEQLARRRLITAHGHNGVSFAAPDSVELHAGVTIGEGTRIGVGATLTGATRIGAGCDVGPHVTAHHAALGDGVRVTHSYLTECEVEDGASIGPFAYLRPGARIGPRAKIGTFVEIKNSTIEAGAKIPHLSYLGDADVGPGANVGAGNITANYDGRSKHRTEIGKDARTGVHTAFVAPVSVGDGAYTGAGSVIVEDVPEGGLGISRPKQRNVEGYAERVEEEEPSP